MNIFESLIVQPIFNLLLAIYALIPGHDFGISIIIFTILLRLLMWPLVKKQLHQTKLMRQVQPELKKLKKRAKGNKALEAQLMMELYKERGVKPFSSIGVLIIQLPIFIALFQVINILARERDRIDSFVYGFMSQFDAIKEVLANPKTFNESLFGVVDLTRHAVGDHGVYIPLVILALVAAVFQYIQAKQTLPDPKNNKKLRDILKESASGKQADQSEISAIMSGRMAMLMPVILFFVVLYFPGALVLYYATFSIVAVIQQHIVLNKDEEELQAVASEPAKNKDKTIKRAEKAKEAKVISPKKAKKKRKRR